MSPRFPVIALAGLTIISGAAEAQPRDARPGPPGDGPPGQGRLFISPSGEPFRHGQGAAAWFAQTDADHDGAVTLVEFRKDASRAFALLDRNSDGVIDGPETTYYENELVPEISQTTGDGDRGPSGERGGRGSRGRPPPGGPGPDREGRGEPPPSGGRNGGTPRQGAGRFAYLDIPEPIRAADLNLDWRVTGAEWLKAADRRFAMLDTGALGKLTPETLPRLPGPPPPRGSRRPPR
ncbi:MAG: hypothetical protein CFE28_00075 [Alphaproteobacteria bacterium PA2]|nr:MAG: hypothetical protein CFE28_00075 [Alphaproteobacteria bacterium PA2]